MLNDLFLTLTPDEAAAYLHTHPDRLALLGKLKVPLAQSIRNRIEMLQPAFGSGLTFIEGPQSEKARAKVTDILKAKSHKGEINLRGINESVLDSL